MEAIGFPISREAACCGIYIYLGSTRVGMKSKEALRSDYLRMYEDNYRADLERRRAKKAQQRARDEEVSSPASASEAVSANSFLSMVNSIPKVVKKPEIIIDVDFSPFEVGATWEEPAEEVKIIKPTVVEPPRDWVSNGTELFSIRVNIPVTVKEPVKQTDLWEDDEEEVWSDEDEAGQVTPSGEEVFDWDDGEDDGWSSEEDENDEPIVTPTKQTVASADTTSPLTKASSQYVPKTFSEVKNAPRVEPATSPTIERLDENSIRDFVKSHKLCSESDILNAFSGHDRTKVRSVIKSALRKYRIFEKHGKYTV